MKVLGEYMNLLLDFFKGIIIGLFMLVPGISGGSIAIILGIYDRLLCGLNDIFKSFKNNIIFLIVVAFGGVVGIFISSFLLSFLIKLYYNEMLFLFVGMMLYHSFYTVCKVAKKQILKSLFFILVGLFIGYFITLIPMSFFNINNHFLGMLVLGIFLAVALILPGISVSYVLIIFGIYNDIIIAINTFDFGYLFKILLFLLIGCFIVIKVLHYLLVRHNEILSNITIGFIFSSIWVVMPQLVGFRSYLYALIFVLIGVLIKKILPNNN